ncbi:YgjV family protein [Catenovulum sp. SX2]|uniref:YgjV family protein n=1 Tax=Catenovulum sp. SX2 TaxID=3398614 RepID=UPI003F8554DF
MGESFIPQLFGIISFILGVVCFSQKDDKKFKIIMLILNLNHTLHFLLMNAMSSALASALSVFRTALSMKTSSIYVAVFFIVSLVSLNTMWAEHWYDWLAVMGACCGTFGLFCLTGIKMRLTLLVGSICWLVNNFVVGSIGGVMLETMVIGINISTILRIYYSPTQTPA